MSNYPQTKIDVPKALTLRHKHGMTDAQIAKYFSCTRQSVYRALKRFNGILMTQEELSAYKEHKGSILQSVEATLVSDLADSGRRKKASLNNTAYALAQVANMSRLEDGLSTVNVAYNDMGAELQELKRRRQQLEESLGNL